MSVKSLSLLALCDRQALCAPCSDMTQVVGFRVSVTTSDQGQAARPTFIAAESPRKAPGFVTVSPSTFRAFLRLLHSHVQPAVQRSTGVSRRQSVQPLLLFAKRQKDTFPGIHSCMHTASAIGRLSTRIYHAVCQPGTQGLTSSTANRQCRHTLIVPHRQLIGTLLAHMWQQQDSQSSRNIATRTPPTTPPTMAPMELLPPPLLPLPWFWLTGRVMPPFAVSTSVTWSTFRPAVVSPRVPAECEHRTCQPLQLMAEMI
jgi:hypothetical protein